MVLAREREALRAQQTLADPPLRRVARRVTLLSRRSGKTMNEDSQRVGPMANPPHLGELIRESMEDVGWSVTETALRLGCERGTLPRLLNGKAGVSANMALALEDIGWGTAEHWMRMQASYDLAQARRERTAVTAVADFR